MRAGPSTPVTVVGLRHGEVHNPGGVIYSGLPGFVLSEVGRREASDVAAHLAEAPISAIYASPLDRAQETASYLAAATGVGVRIDERLVEWKHWEQWAGLTWEELATTAADAFNAYMNDPGSVTTGESLAELADRMEAWLADVEREHASGVVVGVTHLEPLRAVLLRRLGLPASALFTLQIGHCGLVRLGPDAAAEPLDPSALRSAGLM